MEARISVDIDSGPWSSTCVVQSRRYYSGCAEALFIEVFMSTTASKFYCLSVEDIAAILYFEDPMGLYCREYELYDEYMLEARPIKAALDAGMDLCVALQQTFLQWFDEGLSECVLNKLVDVLNRQAGINEIAALLRDGKNG